MDSFLGSSRMGGSPDGPLSVNEVDALAHGGDHAHGTVHTESQVAARKGGGSRGNIVGGPSHAGARHVNAVGLPQEAANWTGSSDLYGTGEMPPESFHGSGSQVDASALAQKDAAAAGRYEAGAATPSQLPTEVGAYEMTDGRFWVVLPNGERGALTPQEWQQQGPAIVQHIRAFKQQQAHAAQQVQRNPSLLGRIVGATRGGR